MAKTRGSRESYNKVKRVTETAFDILFSTRPRKRRRRRK